MYSWICHYNHNRNDWAFGETPQDAYENLCHDICQEYIDAEDCAFYKMQNVRIIPPTRPRIEEIV